MTEQNFDKTITQQERDAPTYLDWSNETLGRLVRHMAGRLAKKEIKGWESVKTMASAYTLINAAIEVNAGEFKQTIEGFSIAEKEYGDWEIIVRRKKTKNK